MHSCDGCGWDMRGLMAIIPADAWRAISPTGDLNGFLCPWCMSDRLKALRLEVCCELHLCLPYLDAKNIRALRRAAEIEHQRVLEKRAANGAECSGIVGDQPPCGEVAP